jgi:hypothetical protein
MLTFYLAPRKTIIPSQSVVQSKFRGTIEL